MSERVWLQNARRAEVCAMTVTELSEWTHRKSYMWRFYDDRVEIGVPLATEAYSEAELTRRGICGLWGWRVDG